MICSTNDERIAQYAIKAAHRSEMPMKHGCVAVSGGKIIAKGYNTYRTYSKDGLINGCSCHAEIDVLRKCIKRGVKHKINLYVVRISNSGEYRNSRPCNMCLSILKQYKIHMLIYSTENGLKKCRLIHFFNHFKSSGEKALLKNRLSKSYNGKFIVFDDDKRT
jgi:tRNA(Arg) A34 adenosine deaminase TadA